MRRSDVSKVQARVVHALQTACLGTDLAVCGPDGLSGGFMIGDEVEAYVLAEPPDGYQVELWIHDGDDAYHTAMFATLGEAIRFAVDAAMASAPVMSAARPGLVFRAA